MLADWGRAVVSSGAFRSRTQQGGAEEKTWVCVAPFAKVKALPSKKGGRKRPGARGFTLIELLCVVGIMSMMMGAIVMAIPGFRSTYARKEAIDDVMGTLEQARVAALQAGENVTVIFARPQNGTQGDDAMLVVGTPPLGSPSTASVFYTKWIYLPKGVRFRGETGTLTGTTDNQPAGIDPSALPPLTGNPTYSTVTFNSTGQVTSPASGNLTMALYEGTRTSGTAEQATGASAKATQGLADSGLYDVIRIARYSGRARVDMDTLQNK